jgi:hypothetical protein
MRKASHSDRHEGKAFTFGIDDAPAMRPWRENRLICSTTEADLYVAESDEPVRVQIHDVSRSGMGFVLDRAIAVGSSVEVHMVGMIAAGEIRYCRPTGQDSFDAGMRIDTTQKR